MAARTAVPSTTVPLISIPSMSTAQKPSDRTGSQLMSPVYLLESTHPMHICAPARLPSAWEVTSDARTRYRLKYCSES